MRARPDLEDGMSVELFRDHDWLKAEITGFLRARNLPVTGAKATLETRVEAVLDGRPVPLPAKQRRARMPTVLTLDTQVGANWRCSPALRGFLEELTGRAVRFDAAFRRLLRDGEGRTLGAVLDEWLSRQDTDEAGARGFGYVNFAWGFRETRPGADCAEIVAAWFAGPAPGRAALR
ncbi:MAG: DUF6434 domain-containing protein [Pseudooceanicola sp.]